MLRAIAYGTRLTAVPHLPHLPHLNRAFATSASERLIDASKRIRNLIDLKKLDKALESFHATFEAPAPTASKPNKHVPSRLSPLRPDSFVLNSLIRGFVDADRLGAAFELVGWMRDKYNVAPTEVTWSLLTQGVAMHGTRADMRTLLSWLANAFPADAESAGGWRSATLLDRHSFVRWLLRACARLGYNAPSDLLEAAVTSEKDGHIMSRHDFVDINPSEDVDLVDSNWIVACTAILHASATRQRQVAQVGLTTGDGVDSAQQWMLCSHALTADNVSHILAGLARRPVDDKNAAASDVVLADLLLCLQWRASMFSLLVLPKQIGPTLSNVAASASLSAAEATELDETATELLLRTLRRADHENTSKSRAVKALQTQATALRHMLSSFVGPQFGHASAMWSSHVLFGFAHPLLRSAFQRDASPFAPPTWLQIGCKRSLAALTLEMAANLEDKVAEPKGRVLVMERASPNAARLLSMWLEKLRSILWPVSDDVIKTLPLSPSGWMQSLRVWFPTAVDVRSVLGASFGRAKTAVASVDDMTTAQLIRSLPTSSLFDGAMFMFPPAPAAAKPAAPAKAVETPDFMQDSSESVPGMSGDEHRRMSKEELAAWKDARRTERRERRRAEAKTKKLASGTKSDAEVAEAPVNVLEKDREWVLCDATFEQLRARIPLGGAVVVLTDDEKVRVWLQSTFTASATGAELRSAIRDFHSRTGMSADFIGQSAREAGYDAGHSAKVPELDGGWAHVATLTIHSLLKLNESPSARPTKPRGGSALDSALREFDEAEQDEPAELESDSQTRERDVHRLLQRVPPTTADMLRALAQSSSVRLFATHPQRSHTKLVILQRV